MFVRRTLIKHFDLIDITDGRDNFSSGNVDPAIVGDSLPRSEVETSKEGYIGEAREVGKVSFGDICGQHT